MSDWDHQFASMRSQFLGRALDRLDRITATLEVLQSNLSDKDQLQTLRQHFHWLSGVGGTYKLSSVSELGLTGEELCDELVEENRQPSHADISLLSNLLQDARTLIAEAENNPAI